MHATGLRGPLGMVQVSEIGHDSVMGHGLLLLPLQ